MLTVAWKEFVGFYCYSLQGYDLLICTLNAYSGMEGICWFISYYSLLGYDLICTLNAYSVMEGICWFLSYYSLKGLWFCSHWGVGSLNGAHNSQSKNQSRYFYGITDMAS
ncbi:hypothetical protein C5167_037217 [Papaver somniferum]|uniref:Uncharacterized protein n=1 Tax=Papaver somniferum TaxID=3469 RepID=A0A4Y7I979_PAPSO|nr:hypothetical protein C5167_037217 [Papaver somniferum]